VGRAGWEHNASIVAAYRERYGYAHPRDPIGPEPAKTSPEARAAWHAALSTLGRVDGIDLRGCTDGDLWLRRNTYERETAWAPPHVTKELQLMRQAERDAHVNAVRAEHEHHAAHDQRTAARQQRLARIWRVLEVKAAREAEMFAAIKETRQQWEAVSQATRRIAVAADLELRRRRPDLPIQPLRPHPAEREGPADPAPDDRSAETHSQLMLGLTPEAAHQGIPEHVLRIRDNTKAAQAKLDELASLREPATDTDDLSPGLARPANQQRDRDAVLQPPRPEVVPATRITEQYHAAAVNADHPGPERG
jgi:hypothetical protein